MYCLLLEAGTAYVRYIPARYCSCTIELGVWMFHGFLIIRFMITIILLLSMNLISQKGSKAKSFDVFYVSLAISFVSYMLTFFLFTGIGYLVLIPIFAANIFILMRFMGMTIRTAISVLIVLNVINFMLPI